MSKSRNKRSSKKQPKTTPSPTAAAEPTAAQSQPESGKKQPSAAPPEQSARSLPGILSSLVVVAVLLLLGGLLYMRANPQPATAVNDEAETIPPELETAIAEQEQAEELAAAEADTPADSPVETADMSGRQTYSAPPPMTIDPEAEYTATIATPRGDIVVELRPDVAPQTVNNFVFLAREGFYDGLTWHRVIAGFMAQGGDPLGDGTGGPGYSIPAEFTAEILFDRPGLLAMARSADPDSAGSQFFITTAAAPHLNEQYTVFGEVVEGQEIVNNIPLRDPMSATEPGEEIISITIDEG